MLSLKKIFSKKSRIKEVDIEHTIADYLNLSKIDEDNYEGRLEKSITTSTFYIVILIIIIVAVVFTIQLFKLQVVENDKWVKRSDNNFQEVYPVFSFRGVIKDRNGELLAWNNKDTTNEQSILKREYIKDEGFSNLLGYIKYPQKDKNGNLWQDDYIAESGLELYYDDLLKGKKGNIIIETDAAGNIIRNNVIDKSVAGTDITLTIDKKLQNIFYQNIKKYAKLHSYKGGAGIMMDIKSGEILAIASYPDFDNNILVNASTTEEKELKNNYFKAKDSPLINRAIQSAFTPGSIVKPFMAYLGLEEGIVTKDTRIYSSGKLVIKNIYGGPDTVFKDWKAHGSINLEEAIGQSSDEYFYQVGGGYKDRVGLGIKRIDEGMGKFLFTKKSNIDFPNEAEGLIPTPEWKKKIFREDWLLGNTYHTSIGQYGYKVSPISALNSYSFLINDGSAVWPHLLKSDNQEIINNNTKKLDLNKDYLNSIKKGMEYTTSPLGTAHYYSYLPFKIAGKSGTAQVGVNNSEINSWLVGYFPSNNPKYSFVLFFEGGPKTNTVGASLVFHFILDDIISYTPEYVKDFIN